MTLSPKEKKYAIGVAIVLGLLGIDQIVIEPYYTEYKAASAQVDTKRGDIAKAETLFRTEVQKKVVWSKMLSGGLQSRIEEAQSQARGAVLQWAGSAGVNITDTHMESPRQEGKFLITPFKFTGSGGTRSISRWLLAIEKGMVPSQTKGKADERIPLRVDDITVTPRKPGTDDLTAIVTFSTLSLTQDAIQPGDLPAGGGPVANAGGR